MFSHFSRPIPKTFVAISQANVDSACVLCNGINTSDLIDEHLLVHGYSELCVQEKPRFDIHSQMQMDVRRGEINIYKHWVEIPSAAGSSGPLISSQTAK